MGSVTSYLYHKLVDGDDRWYPMLSVFYLTYACSFRCPYCSDGAGRPYYAQPRDILPGERVLELCRRIRAHTEHLVVTGGEPLEHPDVAMVLDGLGALRFREVVFTTNGYGLGPLLPHVAQGVTTLVVSLDTLDHGRADARFGVGSGTLRTILANLEEARRFPGRRFAISLSAVVTPDGIDDLYEVAEYAASHGLELAVCPELQGVHPNPALRDSDEYRRLFDHLIRRKRHGHRVFGTIPYLEQMRDLTAFRCRPFTMLVVSPTGDVFYPCLEKGTFAGNLLETADLHLLRRLGQERHGPPPDCGNQCQSACALGFATILDKPSALVGEAWSMVRQTMRERVGWPGDDGDA